MKMSSAESWARENFEAAALGDVRRTRRLVAMATSAGRRPSGKVAVVFERQRDREGAYDFLEEPQIATAAVAEAMFAATVERASGNGIVYVPIDASSLTLADEAEEKDFGPVGSPNRPARGLMVVNALAVAPNGVPLGLIDQRYWARDEPSTGTVAERTERNHWRPFEDKQGAHFVRAAEAAIKRFKSANVRPWVVIDREGDNRDILQALAELDCLFTIRGTKNRRTIKDGDANHVRDQLANEPRLGTADVEIARNGQRAARVARVEFRAKVVELRFVQRGPDPAQRMNVCAVMVREIGAGARRKDALDWLLYTNIGAANEKEVLRIIDSYRARWRVEEFHRTWKQGECQVESAQLRSFDAVVKWATILAAVAVRIERLKYLARRIPDEPASIELTELEIAALKLTQRKLHEGKRLRLPEMPTIGEATKWIAELGGWMGLKSSGPPGSITLARGLDRLSIYAEALEMTRRERSERRAPT